MTQLIDTIRFLEGHTADQQILHAREQLMLRLKELPEDSFEDRGITYYYLLRTSLHGEVHLENALLVDYLQKVITYFREQEKKYLQEVAKKQPELDRKIKIMQTKAYYKLMEKYFSSLEALYRKKDFNHAKEGAYREKMRYRKNNFRFTKSYLNYWTYVFLELTCDYGNSFLRWGLTTASVILLFGFTYWIVDHLQTGGMMISKNHAIYDYFYFSAVAFTTVGFGDITPITALQKFISAGEALTGYLMIGMFLNLLQKKLY